ncbi:MAG: SAM-dependent methyltransferase, partial [Akkermansiaceae bacterium]|nr:SAM-dependent methyltransferase [Akkermansiaceae bacterium]
MPDPDSSAPMQAAKRPEDYPIRSFPATPSLRELLREKIGREGAMVFPEFMAVALYDPAGGYYARQAVQVGREGDFFTSVSVGPLFGRLLARRFLREWEWIGAPWRIIECGAHDGTLAADVLEEIGRLNPAALAALEYAICEPLASLREAQRASLGKFDKTVRIVADAAELARNPLPGIAFGNELLDALPFHVIEWRDGRWRECRVALDEGAGFVWELAEISTSKLAAAVASLEGPFPEGYRTEVRTGYEEFFAPLGRALVAGWMLWFDYGFARPDYYHVARTKGTLRTFSQHRAGECPLAAPGEMDITAHVDFTAVAMDAAKTGARPVLFRNQGAWLTELAREWLIGQEGEPQPDLM